MVLTGLILMLALMFYDGSPGRLLSTFGRTSVFYRMLAALTVGMGVSGGENGRGTMQFMQTLPISTRKLAGTKLLMAMLTVVIPIVVLLSLAFVYLSNSKLDANLLDEIFDWESRRGILNQWRPTSLGSWFCALLLFSSLLVGSLLLWMAAGGVNRSNEIRAAGIGFLVIVVVGGVLALLGERASASRIKVAWKTVF